MKKRVLPWLLLLVGACRHATADPPLSPHLYMHFYLPASDDAKTGHVPPRRLVSVEVRPTEDFEAETGADSDGLRGRIEPGGQYFIAHLSGTHGPCTGFYDGVLELEKPVEPQGSSFSGGGYRMFFVLSSHASCGLFLVQQAAQDEEIARRAKTP